jgi:hypothetical protein
MISPVDGQTRGLSCDIYRTRLGKCGPDAKLWELNNRPVGFVDDGETR